MGKKTTKKTTEDVVIEKSEDIVRNTIKAKSTNDSLKKLSIIELMALEQACNKVCNRYEVGARLYLSTGDIGDKENNELFYEFKNYYDLIFNELKNRVIKYCK